ncbi:MAG TPA: hypothetical protein VI168_18495 [Croceibacterium sp.]
MRRAVLALALLTPLPALAQPARSCEPADLTALAGWHGVWIAERLQADLNGREPVGELPHGAALQFLGFAAPWNDRGLAGLESFVRAVRGSAAQSNGWSFPIMMQSPAPLRFFVTARETVILSQYRDIRYIPTDGRPMVPEEERWPTPWGTSVGCWEGDTLVVQTASAGFDAEYNFIAPHLSDEARFVERLRLVSPDRIENEITVTDPATLTEPWVVKVAYERHPFLDRLVHDGGHSAANRVVEVNGQGTIAALDESGPPPEPTFPAEVALSAADLQTYVGTYAIDGAPPGTVLTLTNLGNRLATPALPGRPGTLPFYFEGDGVFHSRALAPMRLQFELDAQGRAVRFTGTTPEGAPFSGTRQ